MNVSFMRKQQTSALYVTFKKVRGIPPKLLIIMLIQARETFHLRHLVFASIVTMNAHIFSMVYDFC